MKPDVVLFGELLPAEAMAEAESLAAGADLMLCVGSSLEVYPGRRAALGDARPRRADRRDHQGPDPLRSGRRRAHGRRRRRGPRRGARGALDTT